MFVFRNAVEGSVRKIVWKCGCVMMMNDERMVCAFTLILSSSPLCTSAIVPVCFICECVFSFIQPDTHPREGEEIVPTDLTQNIESEAALQVLARPSNVWLKMTSFYHHEDTDSFAQTNTYV